MISIEEVLPFYNPPGQQTPGARFYGGLHIYVTLSVFLVNKKQIDYIILLDNKHLELHFMGKELHMKKTTMSLSQFSLKIKLYVGLAYACIREHNVTRSVFLVNKNN